MPVIIINESSHFLDANSLSMARVALNREIKKHYKRIRKYIVLKKKKNNNNNNNSASVCDVKSA